MLATRFSMASAGFFFLAGLLFGAWKYAAILKSEKAQAPYYVDTAHRSALLYAFACALVAELCAASAWSNTVNLIASIALITYFAASVLGYVVHGALRDTDNQLERPHKLGKSTIPNGAMLTFMISLIAVEVGAFSVLLAGYLAA